MEQFTKVIGMAPIAMVKVYKFGQMELSTKETGRITKPMVKEPSGTLLETSTSATG
jgi:hypothetical protein